MFTAPTNEELKLLQAECSFAIGLCGSTKPEAHAGACFDVIKERGYAIVHVAKPYELPDAYHNEGRN